MSSFPAITISSQTASAPVIIDMSSPPYLTPSSNYLLGLICTVSAGASLTYSVQVTADQKPTAGGNWNNHDILVSQTGSANSNIAYPVTGIRLNVTSYSSGSVNLGIARWP
jgi:hypothetical protein